MYTLLNIIRNCRNCGLCVNQPPLIQECVIADIIWVGLSAVKALDKSEIPLSSITNSGKLINTVEQFCPSKSFYKTNLVKCLPLENDKIRYPSTSEMKHCFSHFKDEIQSFSPKLVFLLGKQVSSFVLKAYELNCISLDEEFNYSSTVIGNSIFIPIHHPSFILVYKRKKMADYINSLVRIINNTENKKYKYNKSIHSQQLSGFSCKLATSNQIYLSLSKNTLPYFQNLSMCNPK